MSETKQYEKGLEPVKLIRQIGLDKPVKYFSPPTHICSHCGYEFICLIITNKRRCPCLTTKKTDNNGVVNSNYFCDYLCFGLSKTP